MTYNEIHNIANEISKSNDKHRILKLARKIINLTAAPSPKSVKEISRLTFGITPFGSPKGLPILRDNQEEVIDFFDSDKSGLIAAHRQFGKTAILCLYAVHILMNTDHRLVICTINYTLAKSLKSNIEYLLNELNVDYITSNMIISSKGIVEITPPSTISSIVKPDDILVVDEAAYISFKLSYNVEKAIEENTNRTILISTPNDPASFFTTRAKEYYKTGSGYDVLIIGKNTNCPELIKLKASLSDAVIDRDYTLESFKKEVMK